MDGGLDEILEVDEENQGSNRAVRNEIKAQIRLDSQDPHLFKKGWSMFLKNQRLR